MEQGVYGEVVQGEVVGPIIQPVVPTAQPVVAVQPGLQPGYPQQQQGFPPQQGYPQQQTGGFPPQQGYPQQQTGGFPPQQQQGFPLQQPGFSAELGAYKGGFNQGGFGQVAPSAPPRVIDSGLVLVRQGSPGVLRFDQFQALQAGMAAPLTCHASHQGNGVGTKYPEERMFGEWRYTESKMVAAQNACTAQLVQGKFIKRVDANLVMDVAFWVFQEGTAVNWVGGGSDSRTYLNGGGRDFRVNSDGTICLVNHPHLYLGVFDPENVDNYSGPRSDGLLSTDEISGNYCCCCFPMGFGATSVFPHGPDVIEQWGWCWFTTLCIGGEVRIRNPGTNSFRHWKDPNNVTTFTRGQACNGLSCLCRTGSRRPLAFQLVDTKEIEGCWCCVCWMHTIAWSCFQKAAVDKDKLNHSGCAWILLLPLIPFNEVRTRLYVNGHPTNGFYGPDPNNIDWYRDSGCVGNGPSCSRKC